MTRHIILGNGNMLACLDKNANIRDLYFPYVGQENHVSSNVHKTGVFVDGIFSWVTKDEWQIDINYKKDSLVSKIRAYNDNLKIELLINEAVHYRKNIFLRRVEVRNLGGANRKIKVFFRQHFHILEANIGDTVYYNPELDSIIDYKGKRYFLIGGQTKGKSFDDYATGTAGGVQNKLGTYVDAEDGILSKNPIEHGSVDSTIAFSLELGENKKQIIDYWIIAGHKHSEIKELRNYVFNETPLKLIKETETHWRNWLEKKKVNFHKLDKRIQDLFRRSLLIVKAQTDNRGAIIAANDTHTFRYKKDTYSYMWPRDGALVARSLDHVGHYGITERFFRFCAKAISEDGYLFHKYRPDGSMGSSWHSWLKGDKLQLPIQEDETALILDALWKHHFHHKDDDMIKDMYKNFIKKISDFLYNFRDEKTGLPKESYDLWEEKLGIHTFTCSTVYAGLIAAKNFAEKFGTKKDAKKYESAAEKLKEIIPNYLYDEEEGIFLKRVYYDNEGNLKKDNVIDVSTLYGLFEYNVLDIDDERLTKTVKKTLEKLWCQTGCGGLCRYENDFYFRQRDAPENPWFISTMWLAEYYIAKAKSLKELEPAKKLLDWVVKNALPSGVLSEQISSINCETLSVAPLTWSHASFIIAVDKYLDKYEEIVGKLNKPN
ncbi:MAG: glycoside hydrolase family 15 protein [Candidatus Pacearchaeota archaeon]|nr:glycoside hydrolase family 15 protein [Candidatus Pacearchaeota archaeon]